MIYKKIIIIFITGLLAVACSETENKNTDDDLNGKETDEIVITAEQFTKAGMELGKITKKSFAEQVLVTGITDVPPKYKSDVSVYYGGTVKKVDLLNGQHVKKGDVLFVLENPEFVQMQQDYLIAKSKLQYLKEEYERQKKLVDENVSSQKVYAKAISEYYTVLTDYKALEKKLQLIGFDTEKLGHNSISAQTTVKSPITGNITRINITSGKLLNSNQVALSIIDSDNILLKLKVFEKDIKKIKQGQTVIFHLPDYNSEYYEGIVFLIGKTVSFEDRTVQVHARLKDKTQMSDFIPGMYVEGEILVDAVNGYALPADAVVDADSKNFVLVKKSFDDKNYVFQKIEVKTGINNNGFIQILNPGELINKEIVLKGAFNLIQ